MENFRSTNIDSIQSTTGTTTRSLFASVFGWMFAALLLTTISSTLFAFVPELVNLLYTYEGRISTLGWVFMFAPIGLVFFMSFRFQKLSYPTVIALFLTYAIVNGISLSAIFLIYQLGSIFTVFLCTCALFGVMAIAGYTTKTDLSKLGSILMIGLVGIVIASLINVFAGSDKMTFIISLLGVVIFTGLTAWDVQKIKHLAEENDGSATFKKLAVMGALTLYLDFINMFLYLLRLFGRRN